MNRASRIRLWVFVVIGGLAVVNAGARYAGLTDRIFDNSYAVTVELADSGGLFERAEVTYRGFTVGRVSDLAFRTDGVYAELAIDNDWRIPAELTAEVHNRSAVGEQYLDLVPSTDAGPFLADGAVIEIENTTLPIGEEQVILATDRFLRSVNTRDLAIVLRETSTALDGASGDLGRLLDNAGVIIEAADKALPATRRLLRSGKVILSTQNDQASVIAAYLRDLSQVAGIVAARDTDVEEILRRGAAASRELRILADELRPVLVPLLGYLTGLGSLTSDRLAGLEETLVAVPWALASAITPGREGRAHFTFVGGAGGPGPCSKGYIPPSLWNSPQDPAYTRLPDSIGCAEPLTSVPRGADSVHPR